MKRLFSILLTLLMIMCFVGCKDPETNLDDDTPTDTTPTTPSVPETDDEEKIHEILSEKIKEINNIMPAYKSIRGVVLSETPLIKTTTNKIKRQEEMKTIE